VHAIVHRRACDDVDSAIAAIDSITGAATVIPASVPALSMTDVRQSLDTLRDMLVRAERKRLSTPPSEAPPRPRAAAGTWQRR
jgi:hypothetical protein